MANALLAQRDADEVGIKWPSNFVQRTEALQMKYTRKYDYKRAKCEDRQVMLDWFDLVRLTREAYGIPDEDIWNFDEAGNQIGVGATNKVVTGSERRGRP
jgi:hypothetical protein